MPILSINDPTLPPMLKDAFVVSKEIELFIYKTLAEQPLGIQHAVSGFLMTQMAGRLGMCAGCFVDKGILTAEDAYKALPEMLDTISKAYTEGISHRNYIKDVAEVTSWEVKE